MSATSALWRATSRAGGAHRDADAGGGERGRVVDAVADHRDRARLAFELARTCCELLGRAAGPRGPRSMPAVRATARATGSVSPVSIDDAVDADGAQALREAGGLGAGLVGEAEQREQAVALAERRSPSGRPRASACKRGGQRAEPFLHQPRAAGPQRAAVDGGRRRRGPGAPGTPRPAAPGDRDRAPRGAARRPADAPSRARRPRRARAPPLRPSARDALQLREPERERAGLVERDRADARRDPRAPGRP